VNYDRQAIISPELCQKPGMSRFGFGITAPLDFTLTNHPECVILRLLQSKFFLTFYSGGQWGFAVEYLFQKIPFFIVRLTNSIKLIEQFSDW